MKSGVNDHSIMRSKFVNTDRIKSNIQMVKGDLAQWRVSRTCPCPVCGKSDWCLSDRESWALCQRVESPDRWGEAGWLHRLTDHRRRIRPTVRDAAIITGQKTTETRTCDWTSKGEPVAVYYYNDEHGNPLYRKVRYETKSGKITPFQRYDAARDLWIGGAGCMDDVRRVIYRPPSVLGARQVYIVEGEKCADLLWDFGICATCNDSGAEHWKPDFNEFLRGKDCIVLPDADEPGQRHADQVALSLVGIARSIKVVKLPGLGPKQDIYDWLLEDGECL